MSTERPSEAFDYTSEFEKNTETLESTRKYIISMLENYSALDKGIHGIKRWEISYKLQILGSYLVRNQYNVQSVELSWNNPELVKWVRIAKWNTSLYIGGEDNFDKHLALGFLMDFVAINYN